jgi:tRNA-binding EMAP/Myf-like protein
MKPQINFEQFLQAKESGNESIIEKTIGNIVEVEFLPKNKKMIKMTVRFGETDIRPVISNIGGRLEDINVLKGLDIPFITNLEPAIISKHESLAMIDLEEVDGKLIIPSKN